MSPTGTPDAPLPDPAWSWIEHWPAEVQAGSFRQRGLALGTAQVHALGRANGVQPARFDALPDGDRTLRVVEAALDALFAEFPGGAFVRLGSRSAKDTPLGLASGGQARTGAQALRLLSSGSRRVAHDLAWALQQQLTPWIWLREWQDIPWADEWRCFVRGGRLVGVGQYHAAQVLPSAHAGQARAALPQLSRRAAQLSRALARSDFVFDVWLRNAGQAPLLIELNPWGPSTEAGLFEGAAGGEASLRWRPAAGEVAVEPFSAPA